MFFLSGPDDAKEATEWCNPGKHKNCWLPVIQELILHADAVNKVKPWTKNLSIQRIRRSCKAAKELGRVSKFISHVHKVLFRKNHERLENNFAYTLVRRDMQFLLFRFGDIRAPNFVGTFLTMLWLPSIRV